MNRDAGWSKLDFAERDKCKPVLLRLSMEKKPVIRCRMANEGSAASASG
jgi:hypothetical protein